MKVQIIKPIKVSEISKFILPISNKEYEMSDSGGEVLVRKGFAKEVEYKKQEASKPPVKKEQKQKVSKKS